MGQSDLTIPNLQGGMNDTTPQPALPDNQVPFAMNVEWFFSTFAERRAGCDQMSLGAINIAGQTALVMIAEWFPTNDVHNPELFAIFAAPGTGTPPVAYRRTGSVAGTPSWAGATIPAASAILETVPDIYQIQTIALNGQLFLAYNSGVNRLHVWDGATWRPTGLPQPGDPTVGGVGSGALTGVRYYRYRLAEIVAGTTKLLSEPTNSVSINGAGFASITVTQGTIPVGTVATHWIVEASADNANFYQIATVAIGTTTYSDTTANPLLFINEGVLAPAIGAYLLQSSYRYLAVDGDRLIGAGNWNDPTLDSTVFWSPTANDPGFGNSERQPIVTTGGTPINSLLALDNYTGGALTGLSNAVNGSLYAFKYGRIYMLSRTQDDTLAYNALCLSTSRGAIKGSIFEGADESGAPCVYFLDPTYGPSRVGSGGIQTMEGLRSTWQTVNLNAAKVVATGCYYKYKRQAHWWVAADGADSPTLKLINQTSNMTWEGTGAAQGGWSLADGVIATALRVCTYTEWVIEGDGSITLSQRPFMGMEGPKLARTDVNITDMGTPYVARIITKPYLPAGVLNFWGAMNAGLLATANLGQQFNVRIIRDWGLEITDPRVVDVSPEGTESYVVRTKSMDDLVMSQAKALQIMISDD